MTDNFFNLSLLIFPFMRRRGIVSKGIHPIWPAALGLIVGIIIVIIDRATR
jgi:hypothetical protein